MALYNVDKRNKQLKVTNHQYWHPDSALLTNTSCSMYNKISLTCRRPIIVSFEVHAITLVFVCYLDFFLLSIYDVLTSVLYYRIDHF